MERAEGLDFDTVKGVRKPRTFSLRKPRIGSHTFCNIFYHDLLSPSASPPPDTGVAHKRSSLRNFGVLSSNGNDHDDQVNRSYIDSDSWVLKVDHSSKTSWDVEGEDNNKKLESSRDICDKGSTESKNLVGNCRGVWNDRDSHDRYPSYEKSVQGWDGEYGSTRRMADLNYKGQGKVRSSNRCSEGVLAPARTSGSDRSSLEFHGGVYNNGGSNRGFDRNRERPLERGKRLNWIDSEPVDILNGFQNKAVSSVLIEGNSKLVNQHDDPSFQKNRPTKVKLKVGGITHTIHANHSVNSSGMTSRVPDGSSALKPPQDVKQRRRPILQENCDDEYEHPLGKEKNLIELPKKETRCNDSTLSKIKRPSKEDPRCKDLGGSLSRKRTEKAVDIAACQPVRKSSRVPKRRVLDGEHDDTDDEVEVYRKNRTSLKRVADNTCSEYYEEEIPQRRSSRVPKRRVLEGEYDKEYSDYYAVQHNMHNKKGASEKMADDISEEDEGATSANEDIDIADVDLDLKKTRRKHKLVGSLTEKKEIPLTARQQALQSGKETDRESGVNLVEFPDGLSTGKRKQKEKLTDLEQQLKKAEAAQRRRQQVEKVAKEIQAEAIRKILGHDSTREKQRNKLQKKQNEMAHEKASASTVLGSNTVRWVMGPTGTVVSFSEDAGLPSIFNSTTCRYPPPREKCARPSCTNTYKYRDSKSNLPLCSLQCYRAVNERVQSIATC